MRRSAGTVIAAAAMTSILAAPVASESDYPRPSTLEGSTLTWCGDVEPITAHPSNYRDTPVYLNDPPTGKIRKWARRQSGFQHLWIDRDNGGWITVAFSDGIAKRQRQLERLFPEIGAVAVKMPHTRKELLRLQRRLMDSVFPDHATSGSAGSGTDTGIVKLRFNVVSDELVAFLEAEFGGEPFCVDGPDPDAIVQPGPQPTEGDGWTLLAVHQGMPAFRTGVAATPEQLADLWAEANMPGDAPAMDFERDVTLWFAEPHGSTCDELRLDDVVVDPDHSVVYPLVVMPDKPVACTADLAGAYQYFVAFERARLPEAPFDVQLGPWDPSGGARSERTVVEADLREPGSVS